MKAGRVTGWQRAGRSALADPKSTEEEINQPLTEKELPARFAGGLQGGFSCVTAGKGPKISPQILASDMDRTAPRRPCLMPSTARVQASCHGACTRGCCHPDPCSGSTSTA